MAKTITSMKEFREAVLKKKEQLMCEFMPDLVFEWRIGFERVLQKWYDNYDPKSYVRTYNLFLSQGDDTTTHWYVQRGTKNVMAYMQISVSSDTMHDWYYDPKEYVFNQTWFKGVHGDNEIKQRIIDPSLPSPHKMMREWHDEFRQSGALELYKKNEDKYMSAIKRGD